MGFASAFPHLIFRLPEPASADLSTVLSPTNTTSIVTLLLITAFAKTLLTAVTFGASIPAGIFLPSLTIGACAGRAVGLIVDRTQRNFPESWVFAGCPADGGCIKPSVYAVIGAASALGGVTRMTVSLVRLESCSSLPRLSCDLSFELISAFFIRAGRDPLRTHGRYRHRHSAHDGRYVLFSPFPPLINSCSFIFLCSHGRQIHRRLLLEGRHLRECVIPRPSLETSRTDLPALLPSPFSQPGSTSATTPSSTTKSTTDGIRSSPRTS